MALVPHTTQSRATRTLRRAALLGALTAAVVPTAAATAGGPLIPKGPRCDQATHVVAATHAVSVVLGPARGGVFGNYACTPRRRRGLWLFDSASRGYARLNFGIAGPYVVYQQHGCIRSTGSCTGFVGVLDARTGRLRRVRPPRGPNGNIFFANALLVNARGWAAWTRPSADDNHVTEVWLLPPSGSARRLDSGPDIDRNSLALAPFRAFWLRAGVAQSFALRE